MRAATSRSPASPAKASPCATRRCSSAGRPSEGRGPSRSPSICRAERAGRNSAAGGKISPHERAARAADSSGQEEIGGRGQRIDVGGLGLRISFEYCSSGENVGDERAEARFLLKREIAAAPKSISTGVSSLTTILAGLMSRWRIRSGGCSRSRRAAGGDGKEAIGRKRPSSSTIVSRFLPRAAPSRYRRCRSFLDEPKHPDDVGWLNWARVRPLRRSAQGPIRRSRTYRGCAS